MVRNIMETIENNTDPEIYRSGRPGVLDYVYEKYQALDGRVGFEEAKYGIKEYSERFNNGQIP